jgi:hypothetical protein
MGAATIAARAPRRACYTCTSAALLPSAARPREVGQSFTRITHPAEGRRWVDGCCRCVSNSRTRGLSAGLTSDAERAVSVVGLEAMEVGSSQWLIRCSSSGDTRDRGVVPEAGAAASS